MSVAGKPTPFVPWDDTQAQDIVKKNKDRPGALMPILTELVTTFGFIDPGLVPDIADTLNLSRAEVHGVMTFYDDFRDEAPGKHVIKICRAESCQAMHADALVDHVRNTLGVELHETTRDKQFTLEPVYCLGNCACSPAVMVDEELYGRVTPERFDKILGKA